MELINIKMCPSALCGICLNGASYGLHHDEHGCYAKVTRNNKYEEEFFKSRKGSPGYKEINKLYFEEERAISEYRTECKDKALELFKKWFWQLWD